ncbi:hypothetical protein V1506DRAFT_534961 [Lipomyces tetrasporus]
MRFSLATTSRIVSILAVTDFSNSVLLGRDSRGNSCGFHTTLLCGFRGRCALACGDRHHPPRRREHRRKIVDRIHRQ